MKADPHVEARLLLPPLNLLPDIGDEKVDILSRDEALEGFESRHMVDRIAPWMNPAFLAVRKSQIPVGQR